MKTASLFLAASMAGAVVAQSLSDYFPQCSLECLEAGTKSATNCSLNDAVCFCVQSNYEAIYTAGLSCVLKECGPDVSVGKVLPAAVQFCSAASASASASATATADSTSATAAATTTTHAGSSKAAETAAPKTTSSAQSSSAPETTASGSSTPVASGRPVSTASTTTSFSTAAAAAAGPMVTAVMLVAGAVAMM